MAINLPQQARKGKSVKSAWNELVAWAKSSRIISGTGVRVSYTSRGTSISFVPMRQAFRGAFSAVLEGERVTVGMGTVAGIEPKIEGVKITGDKNNPPPSLRLNKDKFNIDGKSWICVQVRIDPESGRMSQEYRDPVAIIQNDFPMSNDNNAPIAPLALLSKRTTRDEGFGDLYQIAYFNLNIYRGTNGRTLLAP